MAKSKTVLLPPKTDPDEVIKNLMLKNDPRGNSLTESPKPSINLRQGPKHKGAQELAQLYTRGEKF